MTVQNMSHILPCSIESRSGKMYDDPAQLEITTLENVIYIVADAALCRVLQQSAVYACISQCRMEIYLGEYQL